MKRSLFVIGALVLALAAAGSVYAQGAAQLKVKIAFPFTVGKVDMPAGDYTIERDNPTLFHIHGTDTASQPLAVAPVVTRLAVPGGAETVPAVCFDKVGDKYVLSEIWLPGQDGYLVATTGVSHTHEVVKGMFPVAK